MLSAGNVMVENITKFNENVTDKSANRKKEERTCYTNKIENIAIVTEWHVHNS
jgi:hypothetical protein